MLLEMICPFDIPHYCLSFETLLEVRTDVFNLHPSSPDIFQLQSFNLDCQILYNFSCLRLAV